MFYDDLENLKGLRIYRRGTLDFGDTIAGGILRLVQLKILAQFVLDHISKTIISQEGYSDNYASSFRCLDTLFLVLKNILEVHARFGLPLKIPWTLTDIKPNVLKELELTEDQPTVTTLGLKWNLKTDKIVPNIYLNIHGKTTGKFKGDMLHEEDPNINESKL